MENTCKPTGHANAKPHLANHKTKFWELRRARQVLGTQAKRPVAMVLADATLLGFGSEKCRLSLIGTRISLAAYSNNTTTKQAEARTKTNKHNKKNMKKTVLSSGKLANVKPH